MTLGATPATAQSNRERVPTRPNPDLAETLLTDLLEGTDAGVAVFDPDWRLIACNEAYCNLCGYGEHEVTPGTPLLALARLTLGRLGNSKEQIEELLEKACERLRARTSYRFQFTSATGVFLEVRRNVVASGRIIETVRDAGSGVSGANDDHAARFVESARSRLSHALSAMADGFAIYDADDRLVVYNGKYVELNPHIADMIIPGASYEEMLRIGIERGGMVLGDKTPEEFVHWRLERHRNPSEPYDYQLADGRWIRVHEHRTKDGGIVGIRSDITELKTREAELLSLSDELQHKATTLDAALNAMSEGFALFNAEDTLVLFNRRYENLHEECAEVVRVGATFEEMLREAVLRDAFDLQGMSPEEFIGWHLHLHFNPQDPHEFRTAKGRWIRVNERRIANGGIVAIRSDVTEAKAREEDMLRISGELRATNIQFDIALNNMIQGLCMFGPDQRLIVTNRRYLEMYGFSPEVVKPGIKLREIMEYSVSLGNYTEEDAARAIAERPDHATLRERATLKQHLRDGRVIAVMHQPMPNGGSVATYEDITELERHEEALRSYTEKLEKSNRELQEFANVASHDLQEPLRKIEAFGSRLASKYSDQLGEEGKTYIERMQNSASRMRLLINDVLTYSRVTTKAKPLERVELREVLDDVLSDLQFRIEETGAEIITGEMRAIDADAMQLRQLFANLIGNSLKYQKPDVSPVIKITAEIVERAGRQSDDAMCRISIADNGIGFDNKYKDQIFTMFQRLHGRYEYDGTGIGLATCRKIVDRHNGFIEADGRPGEGATFTVSLPVKQQRREA